MLSTHHAVHSKAYFAHGRLREGTLHFVKMHAQDESVESERRAEEKRQMLHDKMVHGDEVHIREGHANDETPDTYERICRQVRIPRFRECFNLLSVFLSLLSTRVQLVHVWRVLDVIGWLRMPHSAAPTCRVLLHARLRRQRVLPSLSVCLTAHCAAGDVAEPVAGIGNDKTLARAPHAESES